MAKRARVVTLLERLARAHHREVHEDVVDFDRCRMGFCPAVRERLAKLERAGRTGAEARARSLTPERRREIARRGALAVASKQTTDV